VTGRVVVRGGGGAQDEDLVAVNTEHRQAADERRPVSRLLSGSTGRGRRDGGDPGVMPLP